DRGIVGQISYIEFFTLHFFLLLLHGFFSFHQASLTWQRDIGPAQRHHQSYRPGDRQEWILTPST
ncbi:MAG TPA: hypothetical protein VHC46_07130, partial [Thermodesulfobacteriota bacterium]|nr:hypothetical protein [Thermodesulfobacteriota bacterium]